MVITGHYSKYKYKTIVCNNNNNNTAGRTFAMDTHGGYTVKNRH